MSPRGGGRGAQNFGNGGELTRRRDADGSRVVSRNTRACARSCRVASRFVVVCATRERASRARRRARAARRRGETLPRRLLITRSESDRAKNEKRDQSSVSYSLAASLYYINPNGDFAGSQIHRLRDTAKTTSRFRVTLRLFRSFQLVMPTQHCRTENIFRRIFASGRVLLSRFHLEVWVTSATGRVTPLGARRGRDRARATGAHAKTSGPCPSTGAARDSAQGRVWRREASARITAFTRHRPSRRRFERTARPGRRRALASRANSRVRSPSRGRTFVIVRR